MKMDESEMFCSKRKICLFTKNIFFSNVCKFIKMYQEANVKIGYIIKNKDIDKILEQRRFIRDYQKNLLTDIVYFFEYSEASHKHYN